MKWFSGCVIYCIKIGRKEQHVLFNVALKVFYLWLYGIRHKIVREETHCCNMDYSFRLAARVLLYALFHSHGALAGMRNSSMGPL